MPSIKPLGSWSSEPLPGDPAEGLTEEELKAFVGLSLDSAHTDGSNLVVVIHLSRPLAPAAEVSAYVFGYHAGIAFAKMPKINILLNAAGERVSDQSRVIADPGVRVDRSLKQITIKVPLQLLANPDRIILSARTHLGELPLDWTAWRVLTVTP